MGDEVHLWQIAHGEQLSEIKVSPLDLEARLQEWLVRDISILDSGLLVIGREVPTEFGGSIDILCVDADGDLVIVELKRDKTPREITAQALDYASWIATLSNEQVTSIADTYLGGFEAAFTTTFDADLPETLNGDHRVLIVGSEIDAASERIIAYLSNNHGVNINAAKFQYFRLPDQVELLARVFLIEPADVDRQSRTKGRSKRHANLTFDELKALAIDAGIEDLYDYAVTAFEPFLVRGRTRSSIRFAGLFDGSRKVVISFLPGDSDASKGLRYQLYKNRYAELTKLPIADVEHLMPQSYNDWSYSTTSDPDWAGFDGYIANKPEVDRLAEALRGTS
jgi:hypothetical protein